MQMPYHTSEDHTQYDEDDNGCQNAGADRGKHHIRSKESPSEHSPDLLSERAAVIHKGHQRVRISLAVSGHVAVRQTVSEALGQFLAVIITDRESQISGSCDPVIDPSVALTIDVVHHDNPVSCIAGLIPSESFVEPE